MSIESSATSSGSPRSTSGQSGAPPREDESSSSVPPEKASQPATSTEADPPVKKKQRHRISFALPQSMKSSGTSRRSQVPETTAELSPATLPGTVDTVMLPLATAAETSPRQALTPSPSSSATTDSPAGSAPNLSSPGQPAASVSPPPGESSTPSQQPAVPQELVTAPQPQLTSPSPATGSSGDSSTPPGETVDSGVDSADGDGSGGQTIFGFRRRIAVLAGAATLAVLGALYAAGWAYAGREDVLRGIEVRDVEIGGLSSEQAEQKLGAELAPKADDPIPVRIGDTSLRLNPRQAGLKLDIPATVAAAERRRNPARLILALFGIGTTIDPKVTVDEPAFRSALGMLSTRSDRELREGGVMFREGKAVAISPRPGYTVDIDAAQHEILSRFPTLGKTVTLPLLQAQPTVSEQEVARAMEDFAEPAMSAPVTLTAGAVARQLSPQAMSRYLSMTPDDAGALQPRFDSEGLTQQVKELFAGVEQEPQDATFTFLSGRPAVVPAQPGREISEANLVETLLGVLPQKTRRQAQLDLAPVEPQFTTEQAEALGITEKISSSTTSFIADQPRVQNIRRATELINGSVIRPGEQWSMNSQVGERTVANGFVAAPIIEDGRLSEGLGGGVSQLATTTFDALFFAGVKILEHKPHSFYISRYPVGREATLVWPYIDLRFQNDLDKAIYVQAKTTRNSVTVTLWGAKKYDVEAVTSPRSNIREPQEIYEQDPKCIAQQPVDGFDVDVARIFRQNRREVKREKFHTSYQAADHIMCDAPPAARSETQSARKSAKTNAALARRGLIDRDLPGFDSFSN